MDPEAGSPRASCLRPECPEAAVLHPQMYPHWVLPLCVMGIQSCWLGSALRALSHRKHLCEDSVSRLPAVVLHGLEQMDLCGLTCDS